MDTELLLSPLLLLEPVIGGFLVRKDVLVLAVYGANLLVIREALRGKITKPICALFVNSLSTLAILSHESFAFWGLPSQSVLFSLLFRKRNSICLVETSKSAFSLSPSLLAFMACLVFKGSAVQAMAIHESWKGLDHIVPSFGALTALRPVGAIGALGWTTREGLQLSFSTLSDFSSFVWIPGAWMLTIYTCMNLFVGNGDKATLSRKRYIVMLQFIAVTPLFFLGWDFGRWIFLWIASSALLYGFTRPLSSVGLPSHSCKRTEDVLRKIAPGLEMGRRREYLLLLLGIPHCCWSINHFLSSTPAGFSLGLVRRTLASAFG
jgi:hypothetical protein